MADSKRCVDMSDIMFSIVIPAWNAAKTMRTTLDCVAAQTYTHFEIIIVDDKSDDSDQLAAIINDACYAQLNINLVLSPDKLNGAGARNRGIELAKGDFISFLDADDEWHRDKLQEVVKKIRHLQQQGADRYIIYSQVEIYQDHQFLKIFPLQPITRKETVAEYLFGCYGFIQTSTIVLKREYANEIRFDQRYIRHQDYDFCIRAGRMGFKFVFIPKPLVRYHLVATYSSKQKGESVKYSLFWLKNMKKYLTSRDIHTYKAYKLPLRYRMDGRIFQAGLSFIRHFSFTSRANQIYFINRLKEKTRRMFKH